MIGAALVLFWIAGGDLRAVDLALSIRIPATSRRCSTPTPSGAASGSAPTCRAATSFRRMHLGLAHGADGGADRRRRAPMRSASCMGLLAGYYRGWVDNVLIRVSRHHPLLPGDHPLHHHHRVFGAVGAQHHPRRHLRRLAADHAHRARPDAGAARAAISSPPRRSAANRALYIMLVEILPNARGPLIVDACLRMGYTTITIGVLGFLGLGLPPPDPDWGGMVKDSLRHDRRSIRTWRCSRRPRSPRWSSDSTCSPTACARSACGTRRCDVTLPRRPTAPTAVLELDNVRSPTSRAPARSRRSPTSASRSAQGEALGLVGESGCGKSTVAFGVMHYLGAAGRITGGRILLRGARPRDARRPRSCGRSAAAGSPWSTRTRWQPQPGACRSADQLMEVPIIHGRGERGGARAARSRCCARSTCPTPRR